MKFTTRVGRKKLWAFLLASSFSLSAQAQQGNQKLCVYDLLGAAGDIFAMAKDYEVASKAWGGNVKIHAYTDERIATQDFIAGECDAVFATGFLCSFFGFLCSVDTNFEFFNFT